MKHDEIVRGYAQRLGMGFMYEQWQMANVRADKHHVQYPLLVMVTPASGDFRVLMGAAYADAPNCLFAFLAPVERHDYNGREGAPNVEAMKHKALQFIRLVNESGDYKPITGNVTYQVIFHKLDKDLSGIALELKLIPEQNECLPYADA